MKRKLLLNKLLKFLRKAWLQIILLLIIITISRVCFSQQINPGLLCSGGETFIANNQSLEFAIGEIATETYQLEVNSLTQGFFQGSPKGTDINETFIKNVNFRVFPNPTKGTITVSYNINPEYIEVVDLQGRLIITIQSPQESKILNIETLQNGIYLLRLVFEDNIPIVKQIIKN